MIFLSITYHRYNISGQIVFFQKQGGHMKRTIFNLCCILGLLILCLCVSCNRGNNPIADTASETGTTGIADTASETGTTGMADTASETGTTGMADTASETDTQPLILAEFQAWHGGVKHEEAFDCTPYYFNKWPYVSGDAELVKRQISKAKTMGINGFLVDWYGPADGLSNDDDRGYIDTATATLLHEAEAQSFLIALLYDHGAIKFSGLSSDKYQERVEQDLEDAVKYFSSPGYLQINDRPALFVFPYEEVDEYLDWSVIRSNISMPVTLIDKDTVEQEDSDTEKQALRAAHDAAFDGFFPWVKADPWMNDGSNWGESYLNAFYETMRSELYVGKITVGGVWPGFDDSLRSWKNGDTDDDRLILRQNGDVYNGTMALAISNNVQYIVIATWNDFEEGSDIEFGYNTGSPFEMIVDMSDPDPEVLLRSSPFGIVWNPALGDAQVQLYSNGVKLYDELHSSSQPVYVDLVSGKAYELKIWISGEATSKWIKIRSKDPLNGVTIQFTDTDTN